MGNLATTGSKKVNDYKDVDSRCVVKFRPGDDWEGQYGFDWFREGDYGEKDKNNGRTASHYKNDNLIGKYYGKYMLCRPIDRYEESRCTDQFKGVNGEILYNSKMALRIGNIPICYSKKECSGCRKKNSCGLHPSEEDPMIEKNIRKPYSMDPDYENYAVPSSLKLCNKQDSDGNVIPDYENDFEKCYFPIKDHSSNNYYVPSLSLFFELEVEDKNKTFTKEEWGCTDADIRLLINATDSVDRIDFVANNYQNEIEVTPNFIQKPFTSNQLINIKFKKGFYLEEFKSVKAIAHHTDGTNTLAGQLNIVRCTPKTVKKICFVDIVVLDEDGNPISSGSLNVTSNASSNTSNIDIHKTNLRKYLAQAHVIIPEENVKELIFPISIKQYEDYKYEDQNHGVMFFKYPPRDNNTRDNNISLGQKIEKEFNNKYKNLKNALKLFLCPLKCFDGNKIDNAPPRPSEELGGHAVDIPSKSCVVFNNNPNDTSDAFIPCHELLHSFGLWHSFSNRSPHTFEKWKTSNLMDYPNSLQQMSLWRWQWHLINKSEAVNDYFFWRYWLSRPMLSKL